MVVAGFLDLAKVFDLGIIIIILSINWLDVVLVFSLISHATSLVSKWFIQVSYIKFAIAWLLTQLESVCVGVTQESILGPLLFSVYNNDLPTVVKYWQVHVNAYDTSLHCYGTRPVARGFGKFKRTTLTKKRSTIL